MNTFKKHIIASAVAIGFVGAAQAATSVTLYGLIDVGYSHTSGTDYTGNIATGATPAAAATNAASNTFLVGSVSSFNVADQATRFDVNQQTTSTINQFGGPPGAPITSQSNNTHVVQRDGYKDTSRIGVKGQEDLGNGLSAIFKAEFRFDATTGNLITNAAGLTQMADTYVGLKGSFGEVTVGRRYIITDDLFGYDGNALEVDNMMGGVFNRNLSYRGVFGGLTVGADVSTGDPGTGYTTDGNGMIATSATSRTQQYAAGAGYNFGAGSFALGYQRDAANKNTYGLGIKYKVGPANLFARINRSTQSVNNLTYVWGSGAGNQDKSVRKTGFSFGANVDVTPHDVVGLSLSQHTDTSTETLYATAPRIIGTYATVNTRDRVRMISLDYTHSFSKRTTAYAAVSLQRTRTNMSSVNTVASVDGATWIVPAYTSNRSTNFTLGMEHKF